MTLRDRGMATWPICDTLVPVRDSTVAPHGAHGHWNKGSDARGFALAQNV